MLSKWLLSLLVPFRKDNADTANIWFMYKRDYVESQIKMFEAGVVKGRRSSGLRVVGKFVLEEWDAAFTAGEENASMGEVTAIAPLAITGHNPFVRHL